MQHIVRHVGTVRMMKYIVRWYGCGPDADTLEPLHHVLPHFTASCSSILNRQKDENGEIDVNELDSRTRRLASYCSMRHSIEMKELRKEGSSATRKTRGKYSSSSR